MPRSCTHLKLAIITVFLFFSLFVYLDIVFASTKLYIKHVFLGEERILLNLSQPLEFINMGREHMNIARIVGTAKPSPEILKRAIKTGVSKPLLTLFTTWAQDKDKRTVISNSLDNWRMLKPFVSTIYFTNDRNMTLFISREQVLQTLPVNTATNQNIPIFKDMYQRAIEKFDSFFYCYSNSDILFTSALTDTLITLLLFVWKMKTPVLIVGRRTDVRNVTLAEATSFTRLAENAIRRGKLHSDDAIDYFIITPDFPLNDLPDKLVIGRVGYDNYIIMHARARKVAVVDVTRSVLAVHQTTRAGNWESQSHSNKLYNINLLKNNYSVTNYDSGRTSCSEYETDFEDDMIVVYKKLWEPYYC